MIDLTFTPTPPKVATRPGGTPTGGPHLRGDGDFGTRLDAELRRSGGRATWSATSGTSDGERPASTSTPLDDAVTDRSPDEVDDTGPSWLALLSGHAVDEGLVLVLADVATQAGTTTSEIVDEDAVSAPTVETDGATTPVPTGDDAIEGSPGRVETAPPVPAAPDEVATEPVTETVPPSGASAPEAGSPTDAPATTTHDAAPSTEPIAARDRASGDVAAASTAGVGDTTTTEAPRDAVAAARVEADASPRTPDLRPTTASGPAVHVDAVDADVPGAGASLVDAPTIVGDAARAAGTRGAALPAAVQRVLDAVELLENAPPPRQVTLELGDARVRVSVEQGQVRLTLLGDHAEDAAELLRDAADALAERGFDLGGDRTRGGSHDERDDLVVPRSGGAARGPVRRSTEEGLRL